MSAFSSTPSVATAVRCLHAGDVEQAEAICRAVVAKNRRDAQALALLGQIGTMRGRYDEAAAALSRAITLSPKTIDYHVLLAEVRVTQARYREALSRYEKALKLDRRHPGALAGKANLHGRLDQWDKARATLQPMVDAGAEDASMAIVLARIERRDGDPAAAERIATKHLDSAPSPETRRSLWFEIAKARDRADDVDGAFAAYTEANAIASSAPWDPAASTARHELSTAFFTADRLASLARPRRASDVPVFIVGMLRSGSTLTEQIIDAHPEAHGAGEILDLPLLINDTPLRIGSTNAFPHCLEDAGQDDADALAKTYLDALRAHAPRARRICDKYLPSYEFLGFIAMLFPDARIIHTRRDPMDTCLSCFTQKFAPGSPAYTEDLRHLGMLYNDYRASMAHWRAVLDPATLLEIDYEDLVADQETVSRRIIEFIGLEWDDRCLRFYETGRGVQTLSRDQVNKPIYRTAVKRHERYAKHLAPLRAVLESGERGGPA